MNMQVNDQIVSVYIAAAVESFRRGNAQQADGIVNNLQRHIDGRQAKEAWRKLTDLGETACGKGNFAEADFCYQRALAFAECAVGLEDPDLGSVLTSMADCYLAQGKFNLAESLYGRVLSIYETSFGQRHINVALTLRNLADLYRSTGQKSEAKILSNRVDEILANEFNSNVGSCKPELGN
jgi:tetratricopeptide (TPR) repeat protein